jgi:hypothetical protein
MSGNIFNNSRVLDYDDKRLRRITADTDLFLYEGLSEILGLEESGFHIKRYEEIMKKLIDIYINRDDIAQATLQLLEFFEELKLRAPRPLSHIDRIVWNMKFHSVAELDQTTTIELNILFIRAYVKVLSEIIKEVEASGITNQEEELANRFKRFGLSVYQAKRYCLLYNMAVEKVEEARKVLSFDLTPKQRMRIKANYHREAIMYLDMISPSTFES